MPFTNYNIDVVPIRLGGFMMDNLGPEKINSSAPTFNIGDTVTFVAEEKRYCLDYFAVFPPNRIVNQSDWFLTMFGFYASFNPRIQVEMNTAADHTGQNSGVRVVYRP